MAWTREKRTALVLLLVPDGRPATLPGLRSREGLHGIRTLEGVGVGEVRAAQRRLTDGREFERLELRSRVAGLDGSRSGVGPLRVESLGGEFSLKLRDPFLMNARSELLPFLGGERGFRLRLGLGFFIPIS